MEITDALPGKLARLPDGQLVKIEKVYEDDQKALVRRVAGEFEGEIAICAVAKLLTADG
jgi:hypothetical protein